MGLDSYIYRVSKESVQDFVDFQIDYEKYRLTEFAYFRKNSALHSFCGEFYKLFGGEDKNFNGCNIQITKNMVLELKQRLDTGALDGAVGFFLGTMDEYKYEQLQDVTNRMLQEYEENPEYVFVYNGNY